MIFHNPNDEDSNEGIASAVVIVLERDALADLVDVNILREVELVVGCDDGVTFGWKLGLRDDLGKED